MFIKKIKVSNFKSFKDLELELNDFNVLIGSNASGKSNFIQIFKFLRDIAQYGLEDAISLQGGIEYLVNMGIGTDKKFSLEITFDVKPEFKCEFSILEGENFQITEEIKKLGKNEIVFPNIAIYDFDSKLSKKASHIIGKNELEENASNLTIVLKHILEDKEKKKKLINLLKHILPFVEDLKVEKLLIDMHLMFTLQEIYTHKYIPSFLLSDGTINIIALIIALYFEEKQLIIIEEPEKAIHPHLIFKVIELMKSVSETGNKQIIIATQNPEIVKYAELENLLFVSRNKEGFTTITKTSEKKEVKLFLENEIGIEELYVQELIGI